MDIALFAHNLLKFRFYEEYSSDNYFGIDGTQIECPVKNGEKISYKDIFNNELRYEINATHTNDTLSIKASAPNTNNYLNKVSGNYVKEEFEGSGWTGIYSGDNEMYISLTEFQDNISIAIEKDSKKTDEIARMLRNSNDYDEKMITWNNISIEKIDNGIKVEINSSDEELDEFGKISGEYSRL